MLSAPKVVDLHLVSHQIGNEEPASSLYGLESVDSTKINVPSVLVRPAYRRMFIANQAACHYPMITSESCFRSSGRRRTSTNRYECPDGQRMGGVVRPNDVVVLAAKNPDRPSFANAT